MIRICISEKELYTEKSQLKSGKESVKNCYSGGGFVKKSLPFPEVSSTKRRRYENTNLDSTNEHKHKNETIAIIEDINDDTQGSSMRQARIYKARKLLKNAIAKVSFIFIRKNFYFIYFFLFFI